MGCIKDVLMPKQRSTLTVLSWLIAVTALATVSIAACGSQADTSNPAPAASNAAVKIMPLGDSITESAAPHNSYRFYLWHLLINQGYHVDFIGSQHGVGNGPPANPDFDMDHEGHAGYRADEILTHVQTWATGASPDIVLLHMEPTMFVKIKALTARLPTSRASSTF
jgi:acyl-CoA thioesterase I